MAGEKFTVTLTAKIKDFIANMKKAGNAVKNMGMKNRGIVKNMQNMSSAANRTGKAIQTAGQKGRTGFNNISKGSAKATKNLSKFFKIMATGSVVVGALAAAFFGLRKAMRTAEVGAAFQVQARAFANLTANQGVQAEELVKKLRAAAKGTLDTMSTITTASRALLLQIPASRLVELMTVARRASKAMGTTVTGAFSDISLGIGRQSRLILDNLGIVVRVGVAYENYARQIGTTAGALTDFEKRTAFLNEVLSQAKEKFEASSPDVLDFRDRLDRIRASLEDFSKRIAVVVLVPFVALSKVFDELDLGKKFQEMFEVDVPRRFQDVLTELQIIFVWMDHLSPLFEKIGKLAKFLLFTAPLKLFGPKLDIDEVRKALNEVNEASEDVSEKLDKTGKKATEVTEKITGKQGFFNLLRKALRETFDEMGAIEGALFGVGGDRPSIFKVAENSVKSLNDALKDTLLTAADVQKEFGKGIPLIEKAVAELSKEMARVGELAKVDEASQARLNNIIKERSGLLRQLIPLKKQTEVGGRVAEEAFIEGLGARSDRRFFADAERNLESMERLVKDIQDGIITIPSEIKKVSDKLFRELEDGFDSLPPKIQKRVKEIRKILNSTLPIDTIKRGMNQWVDSFNNVTNRMAQIGMKVAQTMAKGFDDFFFNTITGKITDLKSAFKGLMNSMLRSLTGFLGQKATQEFLGFAFGASGSRTTSKRVPAFGGKGLLGLAGGVFGGTGPGSKLGGFFSGVKSFIGLADGGITSFTKQIGKGGTIHSNPTLAAIAEKPGKKEAVVPLEKFSELVQPVTLNINAIDTKSFQQYINDNKEILLGSIMGIKGSPFTKGLGRQARGPF